MSTSTSASPAARAARSPASVFSGAISASPRCPITRDNPNIPAPPLASPFALYRSAMRLRRWRRSHKARSPKKCPDTK